MGGSDTSSVQRCFLRLLPDKLCSHSRAYFPPKASNSSCVAALDDPAAIQNENLVGAHDRRKPVRDHNRRCDATSNVRALPGSNAPSRCPRSPSLRPESESADPSEAPAQSRAAAFRPRLTSPRARPRRCSNPFGNRSMNARAFAASAACQHFRVRRVRFSHEQIFADRAVEQKTFLRHHRRSFSRSARMP